MITESLKGQLSIFFKLNLSPDIQREIFVYEGIEVPKTPPIPLEVSPGIQLGREVDIIGKLHDTILEYVSNRFLFRIRGPLNQISKVLEFIEVTFKNNFYPLSNLARYYEFIFPSQPLEIPQAVNKIRSKIDVDELDKLQSVFGINLNPYSFSLSYPDTPLTDEWSHIKFTPEVNSPHHRIIVEIIKRTSTYEEMKLFLTDIEEKILSLAKFFGDADE
jgi:hypothetical protein